jgi:L-ascorbate metabolism protein UlaG (beta-lactamase superfamily)
MGIADAVKTAEFIDARVTMPMHYGTFAYIRPITNS